VLGCRLANRFVSIRIGEGLAFIEPCDARSVRSSDWTIQTIVADR
jgi:hypothetical protein